MIYNNKELRFASEDSALQYLSNLTGKRVKIATFNEKEVEYKAIFSTEGKKVNLERMSRFELGEVDKNGFVNSLTWDQFKKSPAPFKNQEKAQDRFIQALLKQENNFGRKVDFNMFSKTENPSFEEKVDWLLKNTSAKYTKRGIKASIKVASDQEFVDSYIETMLWSSIDVDNDDEFLDKSYSKKDISSEFMREIEKDCKKFIQENKEYIKDNMSRAGHDFWLTRNEHGAGFWDGDWDFEVNGKNAGDYLTEQASKFKTLDVYVGDDKKIYSL